MPLNFAPKVEVGYFSVEDRSLISTWHFVEALKQTDHIVEEDVKFSEGSAKEEIDFIDFVKEHEKIFENFQKKFDMKLYDSFIEKNKDNEGIEDLVARMEDLRELLPVFLDFYHLSKFYEGKSFEFGDGDKMLASHFGRYARMRSWKEMEFMLKHIEGMWSIVEKADKPQILGNPSTEYIRQQWLNYYKPLERSEEFRGRLDASAEERRYFKEASKSITHKTDQRWEYIQDFIVQPNEAFSELRKNLSGFYFAMMDKGIIACLMNQLYDEDGVPFVKRLVEWPVPDEIKLEDPQRVLFNPIVCADKRFSCRNHAPPSMELFKEMDTIEKIKNSAESIYQHIACRKHPGKLLLRLIRMNLTDMVDYCLRNGLTAASQSDDGYCSSLKWKTDTKPLTRKSRIEATQGEVTEGVGLRELTMADEKANEYLSALKTSYDGEALNASFSMVTPLAIACHNCVYGNDLEILQNLLKQDANPLFSSDVAIKSLVNGIHMLMQSRTVEMKDIPVLDTMALSENLAPSPEPEILKEKVKDVPVVESRAPAPVEPNTKPTISKEKIARKKSGKLTRRQTSGKLAQLMNKFEDKTPKEPSKPEPIKRASSGRWMKEKNKSSINASRELIESKRSIGASRKAFEEMSASKKSITEKSVASVPKKSEVTASPKPEDTVSEKSEATSTLTRSTSMGSSASAAPTGKKKRTRRFAKGKQKLREQRAQKAPEVIEKRKNDLAKKKKISMMSDDRPIVPTPTKHHTPKLKNPKTLKPKEIDANKNSKEKIARVRAKQCMQIIYQKVVAHRKLKENHFTKTLLYQACIEGREDVIRFLLEADGKDEKSRLFEVQDDGSSMRTRRLRDDPLALKLNDVELELLLPVIDALMKDALGRKYPTFAVVLRPIVILMNTYNLYLNHWRFLQLFRVMKLALHENLPGDSKVVEEMLILPQTRHFLGLKKDPENMKYRLEKACANINLKMRQRLRIETVSELYGRIRALKCEAQALDTETNPVDKLFRLATKAENLDLVALLADHDAMPSEKAKFWMFATTLKSQNTALFEYLYKRFPMDNLLTKAFVITLKGKYHQSMKKVFELGFNVSLDTTPQRTMRNGRRGGIVRDDTRKNRQTVKLFQTCLEDVLFERTVFDRDEGRRSRDNFTRQDEEATFYLLVDFLVKLPQRSLKLIIEKIILRSTQEYENRIWFYGFHKMFKLIVENNRTDLLTAEFIKVYSLNYAQWLLYIRDQENKLKPKEKPGKVKGKRNFRKGRRLSRERTSSVASESSEVGATEGTLDAKSFLSFAKPEVNNDLKAILLQSEECDEINSLRKEIEEVQQHVEMSSDANRTPRELVPRNRRRNGSRNFDYAQVVSMTNGESDDL